VFREKNLFEARMIPTPPRNYPLRPEMTHLWLEMTVHACKWSMRPGGRYLTPAKRSKKWLLDIFSPFIFYFFFKLNPPLFTSEGLCHIFSILFHLSFYSTYSLRGKYTTYTKRSKTTTRMVTVLDLVSQIRDVVLVRRTFSSGKPQGVGILEWGGDGDGEISLRATWDQGGRDPITQRRVSK
jgi:hypothetical protein